MDPSFIARLESQARARQGFSPPPAHPDVSILPHPLHSESISSDRSPLYGSLASFLKPLKTAIWIVSMLALPCFPLLSTTPTTTPTRRPRMRMTMALLTAIRMNLSQKNQTQFQPSDSLSPCPLNSLCTLTSHRAPVEQSVSLLAKQAGYILPEDTAITFGVSALPEPDEPPPPNLDSSTDVPPPPKRRRRRKIQERDEGYDKDDPFVDDSEAFIVEPKFYHPPARDGFFVARGKLELKSDSKQTRVRKPAVKGPKKQPLGETSNTPPHANGLPKTKRRIPLIPVPGSPPLPNQAPQLAPQTKVPIHEKQLDASSTRDVAPRPAPAPVPNRPSHSTPQSQQLIQLPQPSTSKAPACASGCPPDHRPSPLTTQKSHSHSPTINGETRSDTTQAAHPNSGPSPAGPSTQTPRQHPSNHSRHSGTPHDPICLGDDEERQEINPFSSNTEQAPMHEPGPSFTPVAGPSNNTTQHIRPPYLKARSLPERTSAGPLPRPLEEALESLKVEIEAASPFVPKKFPNELKPSTLRIAQMALDMNEYDECFFIRLAQLFPYNTFTIKVGQSRILQPFENPDNPKKTMLQKFVKREILPQRKAYYKSEIDLRIARLNEMIIEGMPAAREDYEAAMREYQRTKRAYDERHPEEPSGALPTNASTILGDTVMKNPFDQSMTDPAEKPPKLPSKSFKLTPAMREILYELVKVEEELCETIKDTQKIVDKNVTLKDTSNRRQFYLMVSAPFCLLCELAHLWPDDFMTTQKLSREGTQSCCCCRFHTPSFLFLANIKKKLEGNSNTVDPQNLITLQ
ncbi:hypothetical protein VP01_156g6 [Puccinia sorghi]|uniref:Ubinuclein middle domain-containing protein n=1 Tax=Puccinia sorghi TaxID=27349 RepID=A0A0L6VHU6_9BASI|nr:hypothetical protein VP01_156g6 [Puccinia sorghi]